jgi:hypothetical protein
MIRYDKQDVRELEYVFDRMAPHVLTALMLVF